MRRAGPVEAEPVNCGGQVLPAFSAAALADKQGNENFPVALRVLPATARHDLRAIYRVVRTIDDVGDESTGDPDAQLQSLARALSRAWNGAPSGVGVIDDLVPTIERCVLDEELFQQLVQANLADQRVHSYETFDDLLGYCALSANPIGRLVLQVFRSDGPAHAEASDRICSALQVLEHCQDVEEDRRRGRIYLPSGDLRAAAVSEDDLDGTVQPARLGSVVELQVQRCLELLDGGRGLIGDLRGWAKVAVAGYAAGGYATAAALRRAHWQVYGSPVRPRRPDVVKHMMLLLVGGRR